MLQNGQQFSQTVKPSDLNHPGQLDDPLRPVVTLSRDHPGPHVHSWHDHYRAQLIYAIAGVMSVRTAGGTWVVPPLQAVWVPAGMAHEVENTGPLSLRMIYLDPTVTEGLMESCCVVTVPPLLRELILRAVEIPADYPPAGTEARLMKLIPDELRALKPEPLHLPLPRDPRLCSVTDALAGNPADHRCLADWASVAGASERTLARLFQAETGMTFGTWRQRLRLLTAIARLAEGQAVTAVAYDLGYDSPSAFVAMFRRSLGATPGRYLNG